MKKAPLNWIRWSWWDEGGMVGVGQMPTRDMQKHLREFELAAKKILEDTGADHVVYGMKIYDDDGELEEIRFYKQPMGEEEFDRVAGIKGVHVYALHAMK